MGFDTALSGLQAAATNLQVTSSNIANSQTVGFKESRTEFADVYASSMNLANVNQSQPGSGVSVATVSQQFNQGNISTTQNSMDLAIQGNGFFVMADQVTFPDPTNRNAAGAIATPSAYTRDGEFKLDSQGTIVNNQGQYLLAYAHSAAGSGDAFSKGVFKPITVDSANGAPKPTSNVDIKLNLDASKSAPDTTTHPFDRTDPSSYNSTTAVSVYDSQGNSHVASTYYVKDPAPAANSWKMYLFMDNYGITPGTGTPPSAATVGAALAAPATGGAAGAGIPITFTSTGLLNTVNGQPAVNGVAPSNFNVGAIDLSQINASLKVDPVSFDVNFSGSTQFATAFSVNGLKQDGLPVGNLTSIDVDKEGIVNAHYSNGNSTPLGQVAMARFTNTQGLEKLGSTEWATSSTSGDPIYGTAGTNNFGDIQGSALEGSTVDLSSQLVKLIVAQQAYSANAQSITTQKSLLETILRA